MHRRLFLVSASAAVVSACSALGPVYRDPKIALPARFVGGGAAPVAAADPAWWRQFRDARLDALVDRGLRQSLSIQTALQRVAVAREQLAATGVPSLLSGGLDASKTRAGGSRSATVITNSASLNAAFVFDIFGRARREWEKAAADLDSSVFNAAAARLAFISSLVGSYVDAHYFQQGLALARQNIASQRQTLTLVQDQQSIGTASGLDRAQAKLQLDQAIALLPPLKAGFNAAVFAIATLLAEPAAPLLTQFQHGAVQPYPPRATSVGVPANLLRNRPDVRAAERQYASAVAAVGVAEASMYPSITLNGMVTISTLDSWSFGPALNLPLLNQPVLRANQRAAVATARERELKWRQTVLTAVEEVQTALSNFVQRRREAAALQDAVRSAEQVRTLFRENFELGSASLFELLAAQRSHIDTRLAHAQSVRDAAAGWVRLEIASGFGWIPATTK